MVYENISEMFFVRQFYVCFLIRKIDMKMKKGKL